MFFQEKIQTLQKQIKTHNWKIILSSLSSIFICDQASKYYAENILILNSPYVIIPDFLWFTLHYNEGIAFGIRLFENHLLFIFFSFFALAFIFIYLIKVDIGTKSMAVFTGLVLGGALGNIFDRVVYGKVVDFIDVEFPDISISSFDFLGYHFPGFYMERWPIFNLADSAITVSIISIAIIIKKRDRKKKNIEVIEHVSN